MFATCLVLATKVSGPRESYVDPASPADSANVVAQSQNKTPVLRLITNRCTREETQLLEVGQYCSKGPILQSSSDAVAL